MIGRNDPCWCGSQKKWKLCHFPNKPNSFAATKTATPSLKEFYKKKYGILIKSPKEIQGIRKSCLLAADILEKTCAMAKAGVTTLELNDYAHALHLKAGAIPAPLHYGEPPFPKSICTSLNEVICHGIPNATPLIEGDIVNIDLACILNGYYGDCSQMVVIGKTTPDRQLVVDVAYECLMQSIEVLKPNVPVSMIGEIIEAYAKKHGCSVVDQFVGHGVGIEFHENPQIPHHKNSMTIPLAPGMTFTIEPMINKGVKEAVVDPKDKWTARTKDGKPSAQWEHTLLITETGCEILTPWKKLSGKNSNEDSRKDSKGSKF